MKSVFLSGVLGTFLIGSVLAADADVVKFTFPDVAYPDGRVGTIQAGSKTNRKSTVTVCNYYSNPNNQYLGQFQSDEFSSRNADEVKQFCLENYNNRQ
ncbi:MAG TPA: hypothetical protein VNO70_23080 [Blastocatellia bacterium]|nr:hypothetical protein [Blastocatellia bacterium]